MKQILEVSNIEYHPDESKTTFFLTEYYVSDEGQKEVRRAVSVDYPQAGQANVDAVLAYAKEIALSSIEVEVEYVANTTPTAPTNDEAKAKAKAEAEAEAEAEAQAKAEAEAEAQAKAEAEANQQQG